MGRRSLVHRRLTRIGVLGVLAAAVVLPVSSSAQTGAAGPCRELLVPEDLASEIDDLPNVTELCPGDRFKAKTEEQKTKTDAPDLQAHEREEESRVRAPAPTGEAAPQEVDEEDLARLGYATKHEESREVYETPTERFEKRDEELKVSGDGFKYKAEESRTEETGDDGSVSKERESEEKLTATG